MNTEENKEIMAIDFCVAIRSSGLIDCMSGKTDQKATTLITTERSVDIISIKRTTQIVFRKLLLTLFRQNFIASVGEKVCKVEEVSIKKGRKIKQHNT